MFQSIIEKLTGVITTEATKSLFNALEGMSEYILTKINEWCEAIGNFFGWLFLNMYSYHGLVGPFSQLQNIFIGIACAAMISITLYKIVQGLIDIGNSEGDYVPPVVLICRIVKANMMIVLMPFIMNLVITGVAKIAQLMGYDIGITLGQTICNYIKDLFDIVSFGATGLGYCIPHSLTFVFILIGIIVFFFRTCKYQVDIMIMDVFIVIAAVSLCTDDKNFYHVFVKTFLNITFNMIINLLLFAGLIGAIGGTFNILGHPAKNAFANFIILIGCNLCLISPPELLKNYGRTESGVRKAGGTVGRLALTAAKFI